jgi:hypothetical protein
MMRGASRSEALKVHVGAFAAEAVMTATIASAAPMVPMILPMVVSSWVWCAAAAPPTRRAVLAFTTVIRSEGRVRIDPGGWSPHRPRPGPCSHTCRQW